MEIVAVGVVQFFPCLVFACRIRSCRTNTDPYTTGFEKLCPGFEFTELASGVARTMDWYRERKKEGKSL